MADYQPYTRTIPNPREPMRITRDFSNDDPYHRHQEDDYYRDDVPPRVSYEDDLDIRMEANKRRLAEIEAEEARLNRQANQFGMNFQVNNQARHDTGRKRSFEEPRPNDSSAPYRPESPTKETSTYSRASSSQYNRGRSTNRNDSKSRKRSKSKEKRRSRSRSPKSRTREKRKENNVPKRNKEAKKTADVIIIDDEPSEKSSKPVRRQEEDKRAPYMVYEPPLVVRLPPTAAAPPPPTRAQPAIDERAPPVHYHTLAPPSQPPPVHYHHQAPPPPAHSQQQQQPPFQRSPPRNPPQEPVPRAILPPARQAPQQPPKPGEEDYFNAEFRKAAKSGTIKLTEKEILNCGPSYGHDAKRNKNAMAAVYVGNLPLDQLSKDDVYQMFTKYGAIDAISFFKISSCYVQFDDINAADAALVENGRVVHGTPITVANKTMSPEEARKLPSHGAALTPISRKTSQCRLFLETDAERYFATRIERKLRALGVTVDTTIWRQTAAKRPMHLNKHLQFLEGDPNSVCAIELCETSASRNTVTVHFFKPEGEEHRNMPVVDAILLIFNRVESMRKEDELPPGQIRHIMDVVARGYRASVPELEEAIAFMEERRVKYGGKKRVTRVEEDSSDRLTDTFNRLLAENPAGINKLAASLSMVTGKRVTPPLAPAVPVAPEPPRLPNTEKVVDYGSNRAYDRYGHQMDPSRRRPDNEPLAPLPARPGAHTHDSQPSGWAPQPPPTQQTSRHEQYRSRGPPPSAKYNDPVNDPSLQLGGRVIDYSKKAAEDQRYGQADQTADNYYPSGITYGGTSQSNSRWPN